jgi:putative Mg2+ transporter-C (MgtC) family protein
MLAEFIQHYWSGAFIGANAFIGLNLLGALLLGMLVGVERSYQGRAAGMRTYGLVCMASAAVTVFIGFPELWYGGSGAPLGSDPTRVVQGVLTGIGFLCAGVIMKDGPNIKGLTTAASIWTVSAIGMLLGIGFYAAALLMALLSALTMSLLSGLAARLPGRSTLEITLTFGVGHAPDLDRIATGAEARGYRLLRDTLCITFADSRPVWKFSAVAMERSRAQSAADLAQDLATSDGIAHFSIVPVRN